MKTINTHTVMTMIIIEMMIFILNLVKKISQYTSVDDSIIAGKASIGKTFVDKMFSFEDENDIKAMKVPYKAACQKKKLEKNL